MTFWDFCNAHMVFVWAGSISVTVAAFVLIYDISMTSLRARAIVAAHAVDVEKKGGAS